MAVLEVHGVRHKATLHVPDNDHITKIIAGSKKYYEDDLLRAIRNFRVDGVYVDVGAHIGNHTVFFSKECPSDHVISIEPDDDNHQFLLKNIEANGLPNVSAIKGAIHATWTNVRSVKKDGGNSGMVEIVTGGPVKATTLDLLLEGRGKIGLIKVDVEGLELSVVKSGMNVITRDRPVLAVEASTPESKEAVFKLLSPLGYVHSSNSFGATPVYLFMPAETIKNKPSITIFARQDSFIAPIADRLGRDYSINIISPKTEDELLAHMKRSDLCWFEWCDEMLVTATTKFPKMGPIYCRLHSFEAFSDMPTRVDWTKVDKLIFVSEQVRDLFLKQVKPPKDLGIHVVHNGLDFEHFHFNELKKYGKKIAYLGYINPKKGPALLLYCFQKIHRYDPEYELHIGGTFQDARTQLYMEHYAEKYNIPIVMNGWIKDTDGWLQDKDFIISTSPFESFQYALAEGIACGCLPLIHHWPGADEVYPKDAIFSDPDSCLELLKRYEEANKGSLSRRNLQFIKERYDLDEKVDEIRDLLPTLQIEARDLKPGVTLIIIAKDEEVGIGRCIDSVKAGVDDIIVHVDSKTTDKTAEVATEHGARVFSYDWKDDFAASRNEVLSRVETEWSLTLDAHEYMEGDPSIIKKIIEKQPHAAGLFMHLRMEDGHVLKSIRLYKTNRGRWQNPAHNLLRIYGIEVVPDEIPMIIHDRAQGQDPESKKRRDIQRDAHIVSVMMKRISENPLDTRSMFYIGQQHRMSQRWEAAYYWYERYNRTRGGNQWPEENYLCALGAGVCSYAMHDFELARKAVIAATKILGSRAEAWTLIGDIEYDAGNYMEALKHYQTAESLPVPPNAMLSLALELHKGGWKSHENLYKVYWQLRMVDRCIEYLRSVINNPFSPPVSVENAKNNLKVCEGFTRG